MLLLHRCNQRILFSNNSYFLLYILFIISYNIIQILFLFL